MSTMPCHFSQLAVSVNLIVKTTKNRRQVEIEKKAIHLTAYNGGVKMNTRS